MKTYRGVERYESLSSKNEIDMLHPHPRYQNVNKTFVHLLVFSLHSLKLSFSSSGSLQFPDESDISVERWFVSLDVFRATNMTMERQPSGRCQQLSYLFYYYVNQELLVKYFVNVFARLALYSISY
jgi:hypothetical protein